MSNRKSNSHKRREWWLLCIREFPDGRMVNRSHCRQVDDDLRKLIAEGVVLMFRRTRSFGKRIIRYTHVRVADGSVNAPGYIGCPDCGRSAPTTNQVEHRIGCCIGRSYSWREAAGTRHDRRSKQLSATHKF